VQDWPTPMSITDWAEAATANYDKVPRVNVWPGQPVDHQREHLCPDKVEAPVRHPEAPWCSPLNPCTAKKCWSEGNLRCTCSCHQPLRLPEKP
jgi:hypothetical protein